MKAKLVFITEKLTLSEENGPGYVSMSERARHDTTHR